MIDLRSDTVTKPDEGMRTAMMNAPLGDDVWGDDPTAIRLHETVAELTGKEAALFFPSGTQSNLAAVLSHCGRGDEVILGSEAHVYKYEAGGASALGGVVYCPCDNAGDGSIPIDLIADSIKPDDPHMPVSRLLCLENTINGRALDAAYVAKATAVARERGLVTHLDGARAWNAAVAQNNTIAELSAPFDTVSLCFSKGMGTPAGTVLAGPKDVIALAHRLRKQLGGGMRQVGILAAAALYALENNFARLAEDHANAATMAESLGRFDAINDIKVNTNMVFFSVAVVHCAALKTFLADAGILIDIKPRTRAVTSMAVSAADIERIETAFDRYFSSR